MAIWGVGMGKDGSQGTRHRLKKGKDAVDEHRSCHQPPRLPRFARNDRPKQFLRRREHPFCAPVQSCMCPSLLGKTMRRGSGGAFQSQYDRARPMVASDLLDADYRCRKSLQRPDPFPAPRGRGETTQTAIGFGRLILPQSS